VNKILLNVLHASFMIVAISAVVQSAAAATPELTLTRFGETKPSGWMLRQMQADLDNGLRITRKYRTP
jgi:hypothetical protein